VKWVLVLAFFISFALPADRKHELYGHPTHELYGWMIFVAVPVFLPRDLLSSYGEMLHGDFRGLWETVVPSLTCIVWLSNFTAFFVRKRFIIYPLLAAHAIFAFFVFFDPGFSPAYLLWTFSVVGLHLLRLIPGRKLVPPPP